MPKRQRFRGEFSSHIRQCVCRAPARGGITLLGSSAPNPNRPPHFAARTQWAASRQGLTTERFRGDPRDVCAFLYYLLDAADLPIRFTRVALRLRIKNLETEQAFFSRR